MTRKMSDTMATTLRQVALYCDVFNAKRNTVDALISRELIVRRGARYQVTTEGWQHVLGSVWVDARNTAHVEALEMHADHLTYQRTVLAHRRSMLAAPADAQWYGARNSTTAMTDFDSAMAHVQYGPWWGHTAAREGILAAIADEVNASDDQYCIERLGKIGAAFLADPTRLVVAVDGLQFAIWTNGRSTLSEIDLAHAEALDIAVDRAIRGLSSVVRYQCGNCGAIAATYAGNTDRCDLCGGAPLDESPRFNQRVDGVNIPSATQVARNELIDQQAAADRLGVPEETQRAYEASQVAATATEWPTGILTPMTSVVDIHGSTGRVLRHDVAEGWVYVRFHGESLLAPTEGRGVRRNTLRTVADLWESIEDTAKSQLGFHEPALFYVSDWWPGLDDADVRCLDWRHTVHDERTWGRMEIITDMTHFHTTGPVTEYVRFVMLASYGDYSGSTVDAANHKYFMDAYVTGHDDPLAYEVGSNEREGIGVAVRIGDPRFDIEQLSELESDVIGLADYPSVDDMALSDYESNLQDEWWTSTGLSDLKVDIDEHFDSLSVVDSNGSPYTWETAVLASDLPYSVVDGDREELFATVFLNGDTDIEWDYDTATSAAPNDVDSITEYVIGVVFAAEQPNHYGPVATADGEVWLTADQMAAHALSASPLAQLVMSFAGLGCERCGRPDLMPLDNGTYPRHTDPMTRTRCHASGTKISQESE